MPAWDDIHMSKVSAKMVEALKKLSSGMKHGIELKTLFALERRGMVVQGEALSFTLTNEGLSVALNN